MTSKSVFAQLLLFLRRVTHADRTRNDSYLNCISPHPALSFRTGFITMTFMQLCLARTQYLLQPPTPLQKV